MGHHRAGDQIPADATALGALQVDESMLTGESDPVDKTSGDELLSGSVVVAGAADALVIRVGEDACANAFAGEAKKFSLMRSELRRGVNKVLGWVAWGIGPIGLLVTNAQVQGGWEKALSDGTWQQAAVDSVAVITADPARPGPADEHRLRRRRSSARGRPGARTGAARRRSPRAGRRRVPRQDRHTDLRRHRVRRRARARRPNIERVSVLFLTKTAYATTIAILFGILIMQIPFLPRQLSITDGLTIGIPAFFLALLPNARRYIPGFLLAR